MVALVHDGRPGNRLSETVLADIAVAEQDRIGAAETKVPRPLAKLPVGERRGLACEFTHESQAFIQTLPLAGLLHLP
jgi:hypothetical protein